MAKLFDKLYNRKIEGKLILDSKDELGEVAGELVSKFSTSNITSLSDDILNELKVGDVVQKITDNQKHCYIVTYKEEQHGICLSYFDCGYLETVSYDYTSSHWVYNSTDVCNIDNKISEALLGDLTPNTLEQKQANNSIEITAPTVDGFTKLNEYCRLIRVNQSFKIILCARYQNNNTESASSFKIGTPVFSIPSSIGQYIYDLGGKKLTETIPSGNGANIIRIAPMGINVYAQNQYIHAVELTHYSINQIRISHNSTVSVNASNFVSVTLEINLTLL